MANNPAFEDHEETRAASISVAADPDPSDDGEKSELLYSIEEVPPWYSCIVFGLQHYLVAIGAIIGLPLLLAGPMCIANDDEGNVARALLISSLFFTSGISTVLQSTIGVRLPILQGGTFSFLPPTFAILSLPENSCPAPLAPGHANYSVNFTTTMYLDTDGSLVDGTEVWQRRMRQVQGGIAVASTLQIVLGATGLIGFLLRFIGPITVATSVALIGLDLFSVAYTNASTQWGIAAFTVFVVVLCSQYLKNIKVPIPAFSSVKKCHMLPTPIFKMYPVLFGLVLSWILCLILTATGALPSEDSSPAYRARTDIRSNVISNAPWFRFPYPGQWGLPVVTVAGVVGMFAGVIAGFVESIGDYYACARLSGAPIPPPHAINRGILTEGLGCVIAGVIGTGTATTSFSENIGAIGITRVGSRRVIQVAGILFILLGMLSKFGSIFVTIPDPVIGGLFCVMFGIICAVGISNLQYVDLNTSRNLFIIGFSLFMGLTIPEWMKANRGVIQTGVLEIDQILTVLLQTAMLVGGFFAMFFDNTIPGTEKERGIKAWRNVMSSSIAAEEKLRKQQEECYSLPIPTSCCRFSRYVPFLPEFGVRANTLVEEAAAENGGVDATTTKM